VAVSRAAKEILMEASPLKQAITVLMMLFLLWVAACASTTSTEAWWKGKPRSQMTAAELEEQDPEFWTMWRNLHGVGSP
jgi:hypothetical protein